MGMAQLEKELSLADAEVAVVAENKEWAGAQDDSAVVQPPAAEQPSPALR